MKLTVLQSGSAGNGYLLQGRNTSLLIECGVRPEELFRQTDVLVSRIAGALVTHEHGDHAKYVRRYAALGIPIYASRGTLSGCGPLHGAARVHPITAMQTVHVGAFTVRPFDVVHDAAEPLGFIISHRECGRILFLTDTAYCKYDFHDFNLDHIIVEANYDDGLLDGNEVNGLVDPARAERTRRTHMSIRQSCELIRSFQTADLKTVVLIHLSKDNGSAALFAKKAEETALFARVFVATGSLSIDMNKNENFAVL